jgi:hypothetical protein
MKQIYNYAYFPLCAVILFFGAAGKLPRVGPPTRTEGTERRYFYGTVWAVTVAQTVLLVLWKVLPRTQAADLTKLLIYLAALLVMGLLSQRGTLYRTRPIVPGELIVSD